MVMIEFVDRARGFVSVWLTLLVGVAVLLYFTKFEPSPIYYPQPIRIVSKTIKQGQPLHMIIRRCNSDSRSHSYLVGLSLTRVDKTTPPTELSPIPITARPGCWDVDSRRQGLPADLEPGRYRLSGAGEINLTIRTTTVEWTSEEFTVESP